MIRERRGADATAGLALTAWAVVVPVVLGGAALLIFVAALQAITQFHHPGLIAALIGVAAVGVTLGGLVLFVRART